MRPGPGKEIRERKAEEARKEAESEDMAVNLAEQADLNLDNFRDKDGALDEVMLENSLSAWAEGESVNWENADDAFLERAEMVIGEMVRDGDAGEKLQKAWMDVQAVIDGRERAQAQVASAKETAETLAQAQAESPEAGELAKLKNELTERRNEMQDLAAAIGWMKMFNGTYRSLSKEVKSLEQAVATKEQQMPQKGQQAA
jgi:hypothetical protein